MAETALQCCPYCTADADELEFVNGVLTCNRCGQHLQGIQEETEYQQGIDDARGRRTAAGSNSRNQLNQAAQLARQEEEAAEQLQDAALLYVRCLQQLLQEQARVLEAHFGVDAQVTKLLRQMWLAVLPQTGILEPAPHKEVERFTAASTAADDAVDADAAVGEHGEARIPSGRASARYVLTKTLKQVLWKLLHPQLTLQLCYLSCVLLHAPITHVDIMAWALDGHLPFLELPTIIERTIAQETNMSILPLRCIQAQIGLDPPSFFRVCCQWATRLELDLPPAPAEALLLRAVKELALPQVVSDLAFQLCQLHLTNSGTMQFRLTEYSDTSIAVRPTPYIWLAAVLMMTLKLLYGLGGAVNEASWPKAAGPPGGWFDWARGAVRRLPEMSSLPMTEAEALALGPDELNEYMQFCRQHVFAGQPVVKTLDDVQKLLMSWYKVPTLAAAQQQQQGASVPSSQDHTAAAIAVSSQLQSQQGVVKPEQPYAVSGDKNHPTLETYSFTCLGPARAAETVRLEPDLKAVLVAIAGYYRVEQIAVIKCMRELEKNMTALETVLAG